MKKFEWGLYENRCSFCQKKGHNIRSCKEVEIVAKAAENYPTPTRSLTYKEKVAIKEMAKRKAISESRKDKQTKRKNPRCGFCRKEGHNRKNCSKVKMFRKSLYRANQLWRSRFADKTKELGVGLGSLIQVRSPWDGSREIAIISSLPIDNLTVFSAYAGNYEYQTADKVGVVSPNNPNFDMNISKVELSSIYGQELFGKRSMFAMSIAKVIAGKPMEITDDWVKQKNVPSLEWLIKNHNTELLQELKILEFIEKWK